jgi:hypothetical protein
LSKIVFFKTSEIPAKYKELSARLLEHKQGKVHLSPKQLKSVRSRRSQYALHLRMLNTTIKHQPLMKFYEDVRLEALAKYGTKKKAEVVRPRTPLTSSSSSHHLRYARSSKPIAEYTQVSLVILDHKNSYQLEPV